MGALCAVDLIALPPCDEVSCLLVFCMILELLLGLRRDIFRALIELELRLCKDYLSIKDSQKCLETNVKVWAGNKEIKKYIGGKKIDKKY